MSVLSPGTLGEALGILAKDHAATPLSGGTDLLVHWPVRLEAHERTYLDLSGVNELKAHTWTKRDLVLGGRTTYWDIVGDSQAAREFPLLVAAARVVGAIQIQTRGTWAGNIVNASPAADGVPALMAYGAVVVLESTAGREEVPLDRFYQGYKKMSRRPDQLIVAIRIPRRSYDVQVFQKVGSRRAQAITKVGLAITRSDLGWRVVANSVAPTVCRCHAVEHMLESKVPVSSPDGFFQGLERDISPIDDIRSTAEYRKIVLSRLIYFELRGACDWIT
ncbi:MAG: hypothetical protein EXR93_06635 [Gemmatimonadetes bacterium]|nr:hypothetical protein [Gemmatimonadota bacterium]